VKKSLARLSQWFFEPTLARRLREFSTLRAERRSSFLGSKLGIVFDRIMLITERKLLTNKRDNTNPSQSREAGIYKSPVVESIVPFQALIPKK
jgi:hypothetical protein